MRILVTGGTGFVGSWLIRELENAGHEAVPSPPSDVFDITDPSAVRNLFNEVRPLAVAHLAGVAFARDAARDPDHALRVNVGGTINVTEAIRSMVKPAALLVTSSSELYATQSRDPLSEASPIGPRHVYGLTKAAQEAVAVAAAIRYGLRVVVVRPFNHTGPGQRQVFAVPAFVERVRAVRDGRAGDIPAGNVDVQRDIGDVRDVVRAYRMLLEKLDRSDIREPMIFNVATGAPTSIRSIIAELCLLAGVDAPIETREEYVRADDPPLIVGDPSALQRATGWTPQIPIRTTLADMLDAADRQD